MIRVILALCALVATAGCGSKDSTTSPPGGEFPVTSVQLRDVEVDLFFVADVQAARNVEIRARVNGYLENIYVDEGNSVRQGQDLFKIDDEEYIARLNSARADIESAIASMKSAEVELARVRMLVEKNVIAKTELDLAQSKIDIAKANIDQAKANERSAMIRLEHTKVKSPFDGVINRIPSRLGSLISDGALLTTISDISSMNAYFKVSETDYLRYVKSNAKALDTLTKIAVELVLADGSLYPSKGKIEAIESEFEEGTGVLAFRARFGNPDKLLKHGSTGRIKIRRKIRQAMLVPQKSVLEIQDKNYIFLVDQNNMVVMKSFVPLQRYEDFYIVKSGLSKDQRIVFEGVENVKDGSVIKPTETNPEEIYKIPAN